jgi:hypothetical protein
VLLALCDEVACRPQTLVEYALAVLNDCLATQEVFRVEIICLCRLYLTGVLHMRIELYSILEAQPSSLSALVAYEVTFIKQTEDKEKASYAPSVYHATWTPIVSSCLLRRAMLSSVESSLAVSH